MLCNGAMKQYWLVKQEPEAYSWNDFVRDGRTDWTGVRNFLARKNLRSMRKGDQVLFYHSVSDKAVVGIAEVSREAFPDPTAKEGDWSAVELRPVKPLKKPVTLARVRADPKLREIALVQAAAARERGIKVGRHLGLQPLRFVAAGDTEPHRRRQHAAHRQIQDDALRGVEREVHGAKQRAGQRRDVRAEIRRARV